jgi:hypothetical protein
MKPWFILDVEPHHEETVGLSLSDMGVGFWIAMESRSFRASHHSKRRVALEVPLLPGLIFINDIPLGIYGLPKTEGVWVDRHGEPLMVPEHTLNRFRITVQSFLEVCRIQIAKGKKPPKKPKELTLRPGDPGAREAAMLKLFGNNETEEV